MEKLTVKQRSSTYDREAICQRVAAREAEKAVRMPVYAMC